MAWNEPARRPNSCSNLGCQLRRRTCPAKCRRANPRLHQDPSHPATASTWTPNPYRISLAIIPPLISQLTVGLIAAARPNTVRQGSSVQYSEDNYGDAPETELSAHVEIIFFSTPTPEGIARSYSSGTVADRRSAIMRVESNSVTSSSERRPCFLPVTTSPIFRRRCPVRGDHTLGQRNVNFAVRTTLSDVVDENSGPFTDARIGLPWSPPLSAPSAAICVPGAIHSPLTRGSRAGVTVTTTSEPRTTSSRLRDV